MGHPNNPLILYPPSHKKKTHNKPKHILYPPQTNVSQQPSYNTIAHTYNTHNNLELKYPTPTPLPLPNPIPPNPFLPGHKEYDLVEKPKNTPDIISLWDLLQASPHYHNVIL